MTRCRIRQTGIDKENSYRRQGGLRHLVAEDQSVTGRAIAPGKPVVAPIARRRDLIAQCLLHYFTSPCVGRQSACCSALISLDEGAIVASSCRERWLLRYIGIGLAQVQSHHYGSIECRQQAFRLPASLCHAAFTSLAVFPACRIRLIIVMLLASRRRYRW